jgi:glycerol-3-phosphate acyltransferase PlsX
MAVHVALDAMGSDRGLGEMVSGAILAVQESDSIEITILGDKEQILAALSRHPKFENIHIIPTTQVIAMEDSPFEAIRRKKDSSIVVAFEKLKQGKFDAVVSPGNSGAVLAAGLKYLGRLKGISRPGIAGLYPTMKGPVVMMDVGANVDCRPQHLYHFGIMASAFFSVMFNATLPRVGLLSIGEEGGKGNSLVRKTHQLLQDSSLHFIGNVEGRDTFQGDVDVIVCDGFVGNVCLKLSEGLAEAIFSMLKDEISKTFKAKMGYFLARDAFTQFRKRVDYAEYGGAPLLGLNGTGIICHGRSNALAIKNGLLVAAELIRKNVNDHIRHLLEISQQTGDGSEEVRPLSQAGEIA